MFYKHLPYCFNKFPLLPWCTDLDLTSLTFTLEHSCIHPGGFLHDMLMGLKSPKCIDEDHWRRPQVNMFTLHVNAWISHANYTNRRLCLTSPTIQTILQQQSSSSIISHLIPCHRRVFFFYFFIFFIFFFSF